MVSEYIDRLERHAIEKTGFKGKRMKNRLREAFEPMAETADDIFSMAYLYLCPCYGDPDIGKGLGYLAKAADGGIPDAMYLVAKYHYERIGLAMSRSRLEIARKYCEMGVESGSVDAMLLKLDHFPERDGNRGIIEKGLQSGDVRFILHDIEDRHGWDYSGEDMKAGAEKGCAGCFERYACSFMPNDEYDIPEGMED